MRRFCQYFLLYADFADIVQESGVFNDFDFRRRQVQLLRDFNGDARNIVGMLFCKGVLGVDRVDQRIGRLHIGGPHLGRQVGELFFYLFDAGSVYGLIILLLDVFPEPDQVAAVFLGLIQRAVGPLDHLLFRFDIGMVFGDADGHGYMHRMAHEGKHMVLDRRMKFRGEFHDLLGSAGA
jgi:hypothetical protein